jgi:hypothetical protein
LQTTSITLPLTDAARSWFQGSDSAPYGGQFTLTIPFTVNGSATAVGSVSVVLANASGNSPAATAGF